MSSVFEFVAEKRDLSGTTVARAVRRAGKLPAIVYGGGSATQSIILNHNDVVKHLEHEAVYSQVLDLKIDGKKQKAVLKGIQHHPAKPQILHMDFMRINAKQVLKTRVPLHFINESTCVGVKMGGVVTHVMVDIGVSCLPAKLPEYIEVDLENLDLGDSIHLTDIVMPKGVDIVALAQEGSHDYTVAQVMKVRGGQDDEEEEKIVSDDEESSEE